MTADRINAITIAALREDNSLASKLDPADWIAIRDEIAARAVQADADKRLYQTLLVATFRPSAEGAYRAEAKDTGRVRVPLGDDYEMIADRSKTVSWDQAKLAALYTRIAESGDDPEVYMKREIVTSYKVSEAAYKTWPPAIQAAFEDARVVKAGDIKIDIQVKS